MPPPEFPLKNLIYLNHAAVAPWPKRTSDAVKSFAEQNSQYGSHYYLDWLKKESTLRLQLKALLNAPSVDDIALVKNTSEAISFVAYGLPWTKGDNIVSTNEEFPSNRIPWESLKSQGVQLRQANLSSAPSPEDALFALVDSNTRLIAISSIQFSTGIRLDLEKIGQYCKEKGILFCIDAIQSLGAVEFDVQAYHADFVMADGHKWMFGPEGLGVFYTNPSSRDKLKLTQYGWHMMADIHNYENKPWKIHPTAQRFECGSPNMLGIHAWSASLSLILEVGMQHIESKIQQHCLYLMGEISANKNLMLLSNPSAQLKSGIVVFKHRKIENSILFKHLQDKGVVCAIRGGGIRLSPHFYHSKQDLDQAILIINQL